YVVIHIPAASAPLPITHPASNHNTVKALWPQSSSITSTDAASAPFPITHPASVLPLNSKEPLKSTQTWETAICDHSANLSYVVLLSHGKLVYVAGNNKYVSKSVTATKKKIIAKPGSGVLKTMSSFPQDLTPSSTASGSLHALHSNSLAPLQARLSAKSSY
ncbi:hypothetical protein O181_132558, partial [Austropuccinia psidii MF-1]|nr:hypothetical protein [Austropuccinia psidii MF-1]